MTHFLTIYGPIYLPMLGWSTVGWLLGKRLPATIPDRLGKGLFWVGSPLGIFAFLRHTQLSADLWLVPVIAWGMMAIAGLLAWMWLKFHPIAPPTQATFLLASMVGNTGYIGFPVSLAIVGPDYFPYALFYDLLGSTPGAYGLGVGLAAHLMGRSQTWGDRAAVFLKNPALWSFGLGLLGREAVWLDAYDPILKACGWTVISASLILVGMRLSQLGSLKRGTLVAVSLGLKMLIVPLIGGVILTVCGFSGREYCTLLMQMAMPPAFATLVISEAYELDRELAVTLLAIAYPGLLLTLPLWVAWAGQSG